MSLAPGMQRGPALAAWLTVCAGLVWLVLLVGGITRLTHSGLSIVRWDPLIGILPPLADADWQRLFGLYQESPEYRLVNAGMTLEEFKPLFWWEYAHRLVARLAGACFALPLLWLVLRRRVDRTLALRLGGILLLGLMQGVMGWLMVASGLVDDPRVSPLRLAAHLALALLLILALLWTAWTLQTPEPGRGRVPLRARVALAVVFLMAMSGALVAGTRAGLAYNTFPLMDGMLVPEGLWRLQPWTENLLRNPATLQFLHRTLALAVVGAVLAVVWALRRSPVGWVLLVVLVVQLALGITTVVSGVALPAAVAHQAGAVALLVVTLRAAWELRIAD